MGTRTSGLGVAEIGEYQDALRMLIACTMKLRDEAEHAFTQDGMDEFIDDLVEMQKAAEKLCLRTFMKQAERQVDIYAARLGMDQAGDFGPAILQFKRCNAR